MRAYTQDEIMADAMPCKEWDRERVTGWYRQHDLKTATAIDILTSKHIRDVDAVWQACRMIDADMRQEFGRIMAEIAIDTALGCYETWERYDKGRIWYRWVRLWLSGDDRSWVAARIAAWAAESAAWSATELAVGSATWSAWSASRSASARSAELAAESAAESASWLAASTASAEEFAPWSATELAAGSAAESAMAANREILLALCEVTS